MHLACFVSFVVDCEVLDFVWLLVFVCFVDVRVFVWYCVLLFLSCRSVCRVVFCLLISMCCVSCGDCCLLAQYCLLVVCCALLVVCCLLFVVCC